MNPELSGFALHAMRASFTLLCMIVAMSTIDCVKGLRNRKWADAFGSVLVLALAAFFARAMYVNDWI